MNATNNTGSSSNGASNSGAPGAQGGHSAKIMVVDDDVRLRDLLRRYLTEQGFQVVTAESAPAMNKLWLRERYDLLVLDLMLPGEDGLSICRRLRGAGDQTPIIMLTAKGEDVDRIVGLEMGADDYLPKPFNPRELVARVRAIHRRASGRRSPVAAPLPLSVDDIELVPSARSVRVGERELDLTTAEYDLLEVLVQRAGTVVPRDELGRLVLGRRLSAYDRAIDMHISNLRKKLGEGPHGERIKTVRNAGYILVRAGT